VPVDWISLLITAAAALALLRYKAGVIPVIAACGAAGLVLRLLGWA
jgi:chromate transporter